MADYLAMLKNVTEISPDLTYIQGVIDLVVSTVDKILHNKNQCQYLLQRCIQLYVEMNRIFLKDDDESYGSEDRDNSVQQLDTVFNSARIALWNLSKISPLKGYLQRRETADVIKHCHESLNDYLQHFHEAPSLDLFLDEHRHHQAFQLDEAQYASTLEKLSKEVDRIKEAEGPILDVIYGLRKEYSKLSNSDELQRRLLKLVSLILEEVLEGQTESSDAPLVARPGVISSFEVSTIEGEALGEGGFGAVVAGRWNQSRVAVKQLLENTSSQVLTREFSREFKVWKELSHKHIALFIGACTEAKPPLLIAAFYKHGNVIKYLEKFPDADRLKLCHEIAIGMCFLHDKMTIHGDLKPTNVLVDDDHHARIADFGLSKVRESVTASLTSTVSGKAWGARIFMAPELFIENAMGFSTDVYAFAISVYQILTGNVPFQHFDENLHNELVVKGGMRPKPPPPRDPSVARGLNKSMWKLLERSWAQDRDNRPAFEIVEREIYFIRTNVIFKRFTGHKGTVFSVAFSPDGKYIASGAQDNTIRIWNAATGETVAGPFEGHTHFISCVVFSPDGQHIASGSWDHSICLWNTTTGEMVAGPMIGHEVAVDSVVFSPDGKRIVSGSRDSSVRVWNTITGETLIGPLVGPTNGSVSSVAFFPDGERIMSCSLKGEICVWNSGTGELLTVFPVSLGTAYAALSLDGQRIALASPKRAIFVMDAATGEIVAGPFIGHSHQATSLAFSPDGMRIVSGSYDSTIRVWDAVTGDTVDGPFREHSNVVQSVAFSPDGKRIASGSRDNTIGLWSLGMGL